MQANRSIHQWVPLGVVAVVVLLVVVFGQRALALNSSYLRVNQLLASIDSAAAAGRPTVQLEASIAEQAAQLSQVDQLPPPDVVRIQALAAAVQFGEDGGALPSPASLAAQPIDLTFLDEIATDDLLLYAGDARREGQFPRALFWYQAVASRVPEAVGPHYFSATTYLGAKQPQDALVELAVARSLFRPNSDVGLSDIQYLEAATLRMISTDNDAQAEQLLVDAIALNQFEDISVAVAQHELGLLYEQLRRPEEALAAYAQAIALDEQRYWFRIDYGKLVWATQRDFSSAEGAYRAAIELRPQEPAAYLLLARVLRQSDQPNAARDLYNEVLEFEAYNREALNGLQNLERGQ